jgi:hypothetical protein
VESNRPAAQDLTETGVYRFQRQLDDACVARIQARFNRPLSPADVEAMMDGAL